MSDHVRQQGASSAPDDEPACSSWRFANVEFDEAAMALRVDHRDVLVEPRPLRLLLELLHHAGEVVTKEELLDSVWEGRPTVDHVLANAVSKLRVALGEQGAPRLQTLPRIGYRLAGPVQRVAARAPQTTLQAGAPVPGREAYVLETALGGGTHSDVWRARHTKLGHVHIFKFASDGPRLAALKREYTLYRVLAQELGPRDDFARVLDTHFTTAPFFIECEDGGQSLLDWADHAGPLQGLDAAARVDLFLQVARAVAAAHSVGVLHKDLKPGNILIQPAAPGDDGAPRWQLRLTDFGSGRLLDPARLQGLQLTALGMTQTEAAGTESRSGTAMYLAPELLAHHAPTVQSDVYALGLILYQLLVGDLKRPMSTGWEREIGDELLREDITAATQGEPAARLGSATELIDRLAGLDARREARQRSRQEAARSAAALAELQRRNLRRPWVAAALLCLGLGLLASLYFQSRMQAALQSAQSATDRARAINDFLARDLLSIDDAFRDGSSQPTTVLDLVRRAAVQVPETFKGQPVTEAEVHHHLGRALDRLSNFGDASRQYHAAMALLAGRVPDDDTELLTLRLESAMVHLLMDESASAESQYAQAEAAVGRRPPAPGSALAVLLARAQVGMALQRKRPDEALAAARRLVQWAAAAAAPDPAALIEAQLQLGLVLVSTGDAAGVEAVLARLAAPDLGANPASVAAATRLWMTRAAAAFDAGRADEAERQLQSALAGLQGATQRSPFLVALVHGQFASLYTQTARWDQAAASFAASRRALIAAVGDKHPEVFDLAMRTTYNDILRCDFAAALSSLDSVAALARTRVGWNSLLRYETLRAVVLMRTGRTGEARQALDSVLARPDIAASEWPRIRAGLLVARGLRAIARAAPGAAGGAESVVREAVQGIQALGLQPDGLDHLQAWLADPRAKPRCARPEAPGVAAQVRPVASRR